MSEEIQLIVPCVNGDAISRKGDFLCLHWKRPTLPHRAREALAVGTSVYVRPERPQESEDFPFLRAAQIPEFPNLVARDRCAKTVNGILVTLVAIWPACQFGLPYTLANAVALGPWIELISWTMNSFANSGEKFVAERLKGMAAWSRYLAAPHQLYPPPKPLTRFPFAERGRFIPSLLFKGTIASKSGSMRQLIRLSRLSRALPPAGKEIQSEALATHLDIAQDEPEVHISLEKHFESAARHICNGKTAGIEDARISLSNSACVERGRSPGGAMSYLRERLWDLFPHVFYSRNQELDRGLVERHSRPNEGLPQEILELRGTFHRLCVLEAFKDTYGTPRVLQQPLSGDLLGFDEDFPPSLPRHKVVSIPDRGGFKARVVTTGPAALQALAHNVRKMLYARVLSRIPTRWALMERGVPLFFESIPNRDYFRDVWEPYYGPTVLLSSDLTAATDRFPHRLMFASNRGIESCLREDQRSSPNWCAWKSLSGPQELIYPDYVEKDDSGEEVEFTIQSTCGNLMGTAPSWFLLNAFNLTVYELAWSVWLNPQFRVKHMRLLSLTNRSDLDASWGELCTDVTIEISRDDFKFKRPLRPRQGPHLRDTYILVGDDLGGVCPYAVAIIYEVLISLCNGRLSQGKHFVQPFQEGNYLLVAEEFAFVREGQLVHEHIEHLRGIASAQTSFDRRDKRCLWAQIGTVLSSALAGVEDQERRKALLSMAHMGLGGWKTLLLRSGLPIYLPTTLGGLGWPHPLGLVGGLNRTAKQCLVHYHLLRGFRSDPVRFAIEIAKTRACWSVGLEANHLGPLLDLMRGYLCTVPVSRDENGRLAPIREGYPIGLPLEGLSSIRLTDFLSSLCLEGISLRYLIREPLDRAFVSSGLSALSAAQETDIVSGQPHILLDVQVDRDSREPFSVPIASSRYRRRLKEISLTGLGYRVRLLSPRSNYEEMMAEDVKLLDSLHITPCKEISSLFPHFCQWSDSEGNYTFDVAIVEPHPT